MKCDSCGAPLTIEDEFCPFCGSENPFFKKHRQDMKYYQAEFNTTKQDVYKKAKKFTGTTVSITIIAILVALNLLSIFMISFSWEIGHSIEEYKISKNSDLHKAKLDAFELDRDFIALGRYYNDKDLYMIEDFQEYNKVCNVSRNYEMIYKNVMELTVARDKYTDVEMSIGYIVDYFEYMYDDMEKKEYDNPYCYTDKHVATMNDANTQALYLLKTYLNIPQEVIDDFPNMSNTKRAVVIEEGAMIYDEDKD